MVSFNYILGDFLGTFLSYILKEVLKSPTPIHIGF